MSSTATTSSTSAVPFTTTSPSRLDNAGALARQYVAVDVARPPTRTASFVIGREERVSTAQEVQERRDARDAEVAEYRERRKTILRRKIVRETQYAALAEGPARISPGTIVSYSPALRRVIRDLRDDIVRGDLEAVNVTRKLILDDLQPSLPPPPPAEPIRLGKRARRPENVGRAPKRRAVDIGGRPRADDGYADVAVDSALVRDFTGLPYATPLFVAPTIHPRTIHIVTAATAAAPIADDDFDLEAIEDYIINMGFALESYLVDEIANPSAFWG